VLADGRGDGSPVAAVLLALDGREGPAFRRDRPAGRPVLPGAVTLEELALGADPLAERLVPGRGSLAREHAERLTAA
jgi:hypothetical protein